VREGGVWLWAMIRRWAVRDSIQKTIRRILHVKKHGKRAEHKSIHIQHASKQACEIRSDKQKKPK
jgi:hypothetical protein